ncbi:hypothetical protein RR46_12897 [Papilio xuthus]|uniref:Uncharacterized protein n=1 Tax=Papilio xuthus TaxID=66420 RepID=A0A194PK84_PAPXU|nr:hypothetical protein RR46_12897 [Papilio xuthus]
MWRPARRLRAPCPEPMVISDTVAKRRGEWRALHKRLQRATLWFAAAAGPCASRAATPLAAGGGVGRGGGIGAMTARAHYNERLSGGERRAAAGATDNVSDAGSAVRRPPHSIAHIVPRYKPGIDPARAL